MYERFTDRARKVMQLANQEAQRFNHEYIGTEHILLGMLKEESGVHANIIRILDVHPCKIRLEVEKLIQAGPDMVTMGKLPQTPRAKKVIEYAIEEARNLGHNYVGTEHILLGLLREKEGVAAQVLLNCGIKLEDARAEVLSLIGRGEEVPAFGKQVDPVKVDVQKELENVKRLVGYTMESIMDKKAEDEILDALDRSKEEAVASQDFERAWTLRKYAEQLRKKPEIAGNFTSMALAELQQARTEEGFAHIEAAHLYSALAMAESYRAIAEAIKSLQTTTRSS